MYECSFFDCINVNLSRVTPESGPKIDDLV
jgi:hypothetical protein